MSFFPTDLTVFQVAACTELSMGNTTYRHTSTTKDSPSSVLRRPCPLSPVGSIMTISEKAECETLILSHPQIIRNFKSILSDTVENRKKATLGVFLRSLGYANRSRIREFFGGAK